MKFRILLILIAIFLGRCPWAEASWQIDPERFHVSVHGRTACLDCHGSVASDPAHPDPLNVNKKTEDFFSPESCAACHESLEDYVDAGTHGGVDIKTPEDIQNCVPCHDPHYARGTADKDEKFDPAIPIRRQCGACHEARNALPEPDQEEAACLACHRGFDARRPEEVQREQRFCFHCHAREIALSAAASIPVIDSKAHGDTPHAALSCRTCHPESDRYGHSGQSLTDCPQCHAPHDENVAHDAHMAVSCEACHLGGAAANRNIDTGRIEARLNRFEARSGKIHHMRIEDKKASCTRCHYPGNDIGASAMVLPAKSLLCMPCHTATLSIGDNVTRLSMAAFFVGLLSLAYILLSGGYGAAIPESRTKTLVSILKNTAAVLLSARIGLIFKSLMVDALFQRRLFKQSPSRWAVHALIFWPFVVRCAWGIVALILSLGVPQWTLTQALLNKNHPATGFVFDITGLSVFLGIALAVSLRAKRPAAQFSDLPKPDRTGSALLGGIVGIGFVLEGMRIAMTGFPEGSEWAFLGFGIGRLLSGMIGLTDIYGYLWYGHAVLTGFFAAYLPFSRMLHMIVAPVVLAMNRLHGERDH
jgi:hypothetical protein